ncbi:MAG: PilC/PilY family type IV pilus protein [Methylococcaceae bacterium]
MQAIKDQFSFKIAVMSFFLTIGVMGPLYADDTDIYLGNSGSGVAPNVLFVLDTSSSMTSTDDTGITRLDRMKTALHTILNQADNLNVGLMRFHREGGPVLYPVSYIDQDLSVAQEDDGSPLVQSMVHQGDDDAEESITSGSVTLDSNRLDLVYQSAEAASSTTLEVRVNSDQDDAEQVAPNGSIDVTGSSDLELINDGNDQLVGIRFDSVDIPVGATIESAEIEFEVDEKKTGATSLTIYGQMELNPVNFSSANISSRTNLTTPVNWSDVPVKEENEKLTTPDITGIVEEVIGQSGWSSGNSMVFIFTGSGKRTVESYNGESSAAPLLRITYASAGDTASDQIVGLRFQDIGIPQGATISSASIEFEAAVSDSSDTSLTVYGQDIDDSVAFSTVNNLSNRDKTDAEVSWSDISAWTQGVRYQTPDLTNIVQEIVNRTGWCGNNSLAFLLEGAGIRRAESFEGNPSAAPVLRVNYDEDSVSDTACINQSLERVVSSSSDDAEEDSGGEVDLYSSDLELVEEDTTQTIGIRFQNISIPQGATIEEAFIDFTVDEADSGTTSLTIKGENSADSYTFGTTHENISTRLTTSVGSAVSWSPSAWSTIGEIHTSPDVKAIVQEIVDLEGWSPGNALSFIITGSGKRVAGSQGGDVGAPKLRIKVQGQLSEDSGANTVREKLNDIVDEIQYKSGTPIVDTFYEAAMYYRGGDVFYGKTRGNSQNADSDLGRSEFSRVSHPSSYTGGTVVREAGCTDGNLNSTDCRSEHIDGSPTYISPITLSCQANNIILLSDGYPSVNNSVSRVESLIDSTCAGSGSGKCGNEIADFLHTQDQISDAIMEGKQTVKTFTIGFNILDDGKDYLEGIAAAGNGKYFPASSSAELVNAFTSIIADIESNPTSFEAPALSVNSFNRLYHNNELYFSLFKPDNSQHWGGNVKKYKVCEGDPEDTCVRGEIIDATGAKIIASNGRIKDEAQSYWSSAADGAFENQGGAGEQIPSFSSRKLYTFTGNTSPSNVDLTLADHALSTSNSALTKSLLGNAGLSDDDFTDLVEWIRGKDVLDEDEDTTVNENRWIMSDPLHGGTITIPYGYKVDGDGDPVHDSDGNVIPITKLVVATNDGTLRLLNSETGLEEWAFIPQEMLPLQQQLMTNIEGDHLYGLDSTPTYRLYDANENGVIEPAGTDVDSNGTIDDDEKDYVHVYVGMRRGGRNIYALDITPATKLTNPNTSDSIAPKLLWRINGGSGGDFSNLGQTWSRPLPAKILYTAQGSTDAKDVLIFAGGYHSGQDGGFGVSAYGNAIYIVDAVTGNRLWWASNAGSNLNLTDMQYAIPSDLALMDSDSNGAIDRIYVGDTGGQLWRIDLDSSLANSTGARLAIVSSADSAENQRKFFYPPDVAQVDDPIFSTTAMYDLVTIVSGNRADPLNTTVQNRIYGFRDYAIFSPIASEAPNNGNPNITYYTPLKDPTLLAEGETADLHDATENLIFEGTAGEDGTKQAALDELKDSKGWFIDLKEYSGDWIGEKGLSSPLILDGKIFYTTYVPGLTSDDPCAPAVEGGGRLYAINLLSAGAVYDWYDESDDEDEDEDEDENEDENEDPNDLTKEDRRYQLGGGIPSGAAAVFQKNGVSLVVGTGGGATTLDPDVGLPRHRTFWIQEGLD